MSNSTYDRVVRKVIMDKIDGCYYDFGNSGAT